MHSQYERDFFDYKSEPIVALVELLQTKFDEDTVIVFVEDDVADAGFFQLYVCDLFPDADIKFISCNGRHGVFRSHDDVMNYRFPLPLRRILFLCDLDFDAILQRECPNSIYRLPYYSIESFISDIRFIEFVLKKYGQVHNRRMRTALVRRVHGILVSSLEVARPAFAVMCGERKARNVADLDLVSVQDICEITKANEGIQVQLRPLDGLKHKINFDFADPVELDAIQARMMNLPYTKWARGRQCIQFLRKVVDCCLDAQTKAKVIDVLGARGLLEVYHSGIELDGFNEYVERMEAFPN